MKRKDANEQAAELVQAGDGKTCGEDLLGSTKLKKLLTTAKKKEAARKKRKNA
jgi:hypothetical protein